MSLGRQLSVKLQHSLKVLIQRVYFMMEGGVTYALCYALRMRFRVNHSAPSNLEPLGQSRSFLHLTVALNQSASLFHLPNSFSLVNAIVQVIYNLL